LRLHGVLGTIKLVGGVTVKEIRPKNEVVAHVPLVVCEVKKKFAFPLLGRNSLDESFPTWRENWLTTAHAVSSEVSSVMADLAKSIRMCSQIQILLLKEILLS